MPVPYRTANLHTVCGSEKTHAQHQGLWEVAEFGRIILTPLDKIAGEDRAARGVQDGGHTANGDGEELVDVRADAVVGRADRLGASHASKKIVLLLRVQDIVESGERGA